MKLGTQSLSLPTDEEAGSPPEAPRPPPASEPSTQSSPAPAPAAEPPQLAVRELLCFPLRLVPELPLPTTALCRYRAPGMSPQGAPPTPLTVVLTTSGQVAQRAAKLGALVLTGEELRVLAVGVEQGRATWPMVPRWAARKAQQPGWQLTTGELFAGVQEPVRAQGWATGDVLSLLELELLAVAAGVDEGLQLLGEGGEGGEGGEAA